MDPQEAAHAVLGDLSYNQAVGLVAEGLETDDSVAALQAQGWLQENQSQASLLLKSGTCRKREAFVVIEAPV